MSCEYCVYAENTQEEFYNISGDVVTQEFLKCRRFPPTKEGWPRVKEHDWCGEHEERKSKSR